MTLKTDVATREELASLGIFSAEEIDVKVSDLLAKGTIVPYEPPAEPTGTEAEIARLDALALNWELEKGGDEDGDEDDEAEPEEDPDDKNNNGVPDDEEDGSYADDGANMVAKALTDTLSGPLQMLAKAITDIGSRQKRHEAKVMRRMTVVGDSVKGILEITRADLAKGSRDNGVGAIVRRIDSLEKALGAQITGPRGDYRGVRAGDFEPVAHPGDGNGEDDKDLAKAINPRTLTNFMLVEQKKALDDGDQVKAAALHKAVFSIDATTSNDELSRYATQFGFPLPQ